MVVLPCEVDDQGKNYMYYEGSKNIQCMTLCQLYAVTCAYPSIVTHTATCTCIDVHVHVNVGRV